MCGIAGKVALHGPVSRALIEAMCERQAHRGPDSRGLHLGDGVGLGIQRLSVIDLETGNQPIYNEDRSVAVVLNGEIYNFSELRRDLERRGHFFATQSDTEVIAHLYEEKGKELVHDLKGMFALAVWDAGNQRLVLARDRVGKKPLFYSQGEGWLSFASELRALMADDQIRREVDPVSVDCFLAYGYVPSPWSIWRDVRKLPPAHTLVWERGSVTIDRYWELDYSRKRNEQPAELEEELRRLLQAAVRRRLIADVPLGAFLSGGVDSSIVVSEMAAASSKPVKTFSIGFAEQEYNELPRAREVAARFETDHHEFVVSPDATAIAPQVVRHYGEPYADSSAIPTFYLAEVTRRHVTVALNGDGGDESFAGYLRYVANSMSANVPPRLGRVAAGAGRLISANGGSRRLSGRAKRLLMSLEADPVERYTRHISIFNAQERQALLDPAFREGLDPGRAPEVIATRWREATGDSVLDILMEIDVHTYLPEDLLVKVDVATMAHSLEARSPLLDQDLMEFAASLPPRRKARFGQKKWLLRKAYRGRVPDRSLDGAKKGFGVPLASWFRGDLRDFAREVLLDDRTSGRGYTTREQLESLLTRHEDPHRDHSAQIWALLMLELWHREFTG